MNAALRHALTLVETLAVIALIGLAFAVLAPMLAGVTGAARLDTAVHRFLELDARARFLARREARVSLRVDGGGWRVTVGHDEPTPMFVDLQQDRWARIEILVVGVGPVEQIRYDRSGRSADLDVTVFADGGARSVRIAGLTGWAELGERP